MIKKLRKKFILINMILISIVLLIIFGTLLFFHEKRLETNVLARMGQVLDRPFNSAELLEISSAQKRNPTPADFIPVFIVLANQDGSIIDQKSENLPLSEDLVASAIQESLASPEDTGILSDLNLRYCKRTNPDGICIVLADRNYEISSMRTMFINCIIVFLLAFIAFFFITLFLARWAMRPVEEAWTQQSQFVADASHELKTPLTVILANLNILLSHPEDTIRQQFKWIENTYAESTRMKKLVDHLLFLAKSDAQQISVDFSSFNLSETAWSCLLPFESIAFEQSVSITEEIMPNLWMYGNEEQIKQLIVILLDNACKYTDKNGSVHFSLTAEQNKIFLKVQNTGEPIPPQDLDHIFERFYRSDKSRSHQQKGGYGLGLAIAQSIVLKHHGKISVSSTFQEGTIFSIILSVDKKGELPSRS